MTTEQTQQHSLEQLKGEYGRAMLKAGIAALETNTAILRNNHDAELKEEASRAILRSVETNMRYFFSPIDVDNT